MSLYLHQAEIIIKLAKTFNVTYYFEPKVSPNWQFWNVVMHMMMLVIMFLEIMKHINSSDSHKIGSES